MSLTNTNKVELIGHYGSDEIIALSAWTSTSRELNDEKRGRIGKLLTMLAKEGHHTPFEKSSLHFLVTSDIASHIHLLKHRIGVNINAESARYKEFTIDKFCIKQLESQGISRKRAKESARFYLPYGIQITCDIMFNWRSFAHFQKLRNEEHAQVEIQDIAKQMLSLAEQTGAFPETINAMRIAGLLPNKEQ